MTRREALEEAAGLLEHISRKGYGIIVEGEPYVNEHRKMEWLILADHLFEILEEMEREGV